MYEFMNLMFLLIIFMFWCMIFKGTCVEPTYYSSTHIRYYIMVAVSFFSMLVNKYILYFSLFELTLILLTLAMMKCGSQFDRNTSVNFLYLYSILSSIGFMMFMSMESSYNSTILNLMTLKNEVSFPLMAFFFILLISLVKSPMYSLHHWLPKVHVESPMMNSMILSSFMLKLSTLLLVYMMNFFIVSSKLVMLIIMFLTFVSTMMMLRQTDFKMFVAYSSVMHMTFSLVSLFFSNVDTYLSMMIMSLMHGIISPLMFSVVYITYEWTNERSVTSNLSHYGNNTLYTYMLISMFLFNMSFPIFSSFLSEMMMASTVVMMSDIVMMVNFLLFFFLSSLMTFILIIKLVKVNNYKPNYTAEFFRGTTRLRYDFNVIHLDVLNMLLVSLFYLYIYTYL